MIHRLITRREGQGMAEYALILALVAIVAIGGLFILGPKVQGIFKSIAENLQ